MKKNKLMRIASVLLVATLLSTSVISGTFAKYVTTDEAQDAARVAKFGILTSADGKLFGDHYTAASGNVIEATSSNTAATVTAFDQTATSVDDVVAPGTMNDRGMTLSVKGTAEVSTILHIDAPEDTDHHDLVNTDIFLAKDLGYSVMMKYAYNDVVITSDNLAYYYTLDSTSKTFIQLSAVPTSGVVYKRIAYISPKEFTANYYPIEWKLNGGSVINTVADLQTAVLTLFAADTEHHNPPAVSRDPNTAWNLSAKITWAWQFGTPWTEGTSPQWENTSLKDKQDTILGDLIARAMSGENDLGYEIAVQPDGAPLTLVEYSQIAAATNSANKVYVAYYGERPSSWDAANVACLTVSYGARLTVEQVD